MFVVKPGLLSLVLLFSQCRNDHQEWLSDAARTELVGALALFEPPWSCLGRLNRYGHQGLQGWVLLMCNMSPSFTQKTTGNIPASFIMEKICVIGPHDDVWVLKSLQGDLRLWCQLLVSVWGFLAESKFRNVTWVLLHNTPLCALCDFGVLLGATITFEQQTNLMWHGWQEGITGTKVVFLQSCDDETIQLWSVHVTSGLFVVQK